MLNRDYFRLVVNKPDWFTIVYKIYEYQILFKVSYFSIYIIDLLNFTTHYTNPLISQHIYCLVNENNKMLFERLTLPHKINMAQHGFAETR